MQIFIKITLLSLFLLPMLTGEAHSQSADTVSYTQKKEEPKPLSNPDYQKVVDQTSTPVPIKETYFRKEDKNEANNPSDALPIKNSGKREEN